MTKIRSMKIRIISEQFNKKLYDAKSVHPLQSWDWGQARQKMGIEVLRLGEFNKDQPINVFQLTFHKIPYTPFTIGYVPRSVIPSENVLSVITEQGRIRKALFIKIEPYVIKSEIQNPKSKSNPKSKVPNFKRPISTSSNGSFANFNQFQQVSTISPHPLFPAWTQILDLTKSEDDLMKNMHPKTRYNIRLAGKKGVFVKEMTTREGFDIFSKLYFETCQRQGYRGHTLNYHKIIFETLKNQISHLLIAFYNDKGKITPLSAFELFTFNDVCYYPYGGSTTEYRNLMAANLLMWEAILFAKRNDCRNFDMWGSLPPDYDRDSPWGGFTRFKEGYGGQFVEFIGSYDLIVNPILYSLYNQIYKIRSRII